MQNFIEKEELMIEAFSCQNFREKLDDVRHQIEKEISKMILYIDDKTSGTLKLFENPESRVKGINSFKEKIKRRGYLKTWENANNIEDEQRIICKNLPDLIGFRINCFFIESEDKIFREILSYCNEGKFQNAVFNFKNCPDKMDNGGKIYKWTGTYQDEYSFEIQIKALVNNLWGEVEHKTIYKNEKFDVDGSTKKNITNETLHVLEATNKQLNSLYNQNFNENDLIKSLFYEYTKYEIEEKFHTLYLAKLYESFFNLIGDFSVVKKYVAAKVLGDNNIYTYVRPKIKISNNIDYFEIIRKTIETRYYEYDIDVCRSIFNILYEELDDLEFKKYIAMQILPESEYDDDLNDKGMPYTNYDTEDGDIDDISIGNGYSLTEKDICEALDLRFKPRKEFRNEQ